MKTTEKSLFRLTANDIMSREVLTIPQETSLQSAARMLAHDHISGAPVIDAQGRCVGVLSTSDFVRWAENGAKVNLVPTAVEAVYCSEWQIVNLEYLPQDAVRLYMSADPVTADPETRLTDLARRMLDAHIHRVIIVDADRLPIGVVSSTDVLAAVAYAERAAHDE